MSESTSSPLLSIASAIEKSWEYSRKWAGFFLEWERGKGTFIDRRLRDVFHLEDRLTRLE